MAKLIVNTGIVANDGTGDPIRNALIKVQANFDELYTELGDGTTLDSSVSVTGTPANNQLAIWTFAGILEGDANLHWDGATLTVIGAASITGATTIVGATDITGLVTVTGAVLNSKGADVASATELLVLTDGNSFDVTGTTTIATIEETADAFSIGSVIVLHFDGAVTLTHSASLVLPGAVDITTVAGDVATFHKFAAGDWELTSFTGLATLTSPGITELATDAEGDTGTDTSRVPPVSTVKSMIATHGFTGSNSYASAAQTITSAAQLILPHGLTVKPKIITMFIKCTTIDGGYAVNDELEVSSGQQSSSVADNFGMSTLADATNITIRFASGTSVFLGIDPTTGNVTTLTNTNWDLYVKAWA